MPRKTGKAILVLFIAAFLYMGCAKPAVAGTIIRDQEIEEGLKIFAAPIFKEAGLSKNSVTFIIIDDPALNAFVAGGMNMFFNTGLILETETVNELLGVIAHETGHIASGHLVRGSQEFEDLSLQTLVANILGIAAAASGAGEAGMAISSFGNTIAARQAMGYSRTQESAADQAGVLYLKDANLSTKGMLHFMEKLESEELLPTSQQSEYIRTHPLTRDRIRFLEHATRNENDIPAPTEWQERHKRIKAKLLGYLYPDQALKRRGDDIATRYSHAIALYRKGRTDQALEKLDALIDAEPENPWFYELKGQILYEDGDIGAALKPYRQALEYRPQAGQIMIALAQALLQMPASVAPYAVNEAIVLLKQSLQLEKRMSQPHRLLAIAYGKKGNEGMLRLHLAEEALMLNRLSFADRQIQLAKQALDKNSAGWLHAQDLSAMINRRLEK